MSAFASRAAEGDASPTTRELIEFEALWPDRSARRRYEGQLMTHSDMIRVKWGLTETRYRQILFGALGYDLEACIAIDPRTTYRLLAKAADQRPPRAARVVGGLR